jgi:hypothetical protein
MTIIASHGDGELEPRPARRLLRWESADTCDETASDHVIEIGRSSIRARRSAYQRGHRLGDMALWVHNWE